MARTRTRDRHRNQHAARSAPGTPASASRPAEAATPSSRRRPGAWSGLPLPEGWVTLPILLAVTALVHATALATYFAQDDVTFLARARGLVPTPWSLARPLSEGWTWRLLDSAFGFDPLPYHVFNFSLHLINTALVFAIGKRLLRSDLAAFAAGLLFGASSIAFTPLHWISGLVELMVATFALAAFLLYLIARAPPRAPSSPPADAAPTTPATAPDKPNAAAPGGVGRTALLWLSALMVLCALLSKESAILFPLVLVVANRRLDPPAPARALLPPTLAAAVYAVGFLATLRLVHYVGSETYAMSRNPLFVWLNLSTYLEWLVTVTDPVRDAVAAMDPMAWRIGLPVAIGIAAILWTQRRERRHPEEVGLAWFLAFLAPVVALKHHTYLYYLYLPWPGMCWLLAGAGQRLLRRRVRPLAWAVAGVLMAFVGIELKNAWARERVTVGPFPRDKTIRESRMLKNALKDLRAAGLKPGDRIAFINPSPRRHYSVADTTVQSRVTLSYVPLEGALRGGEVVRVFLPGVEYLGFKTTLPPQWEDAQVFFYHDDGTLRAFGRGGHALAELGYFTLRLRDWENAEAMFLRSRALGDTLADATFGLIITSDFLNRPDDSERYAQEFLRRWPNDSRAAVVASGNSGTTPSPSSTTGP